MGACRRCLARAWLLSRLAGHLDVVRARIDEVLGLDERQLIEAVAGDEAGALTRELEGFDAGAARELARRCGVEAVCRCDRRYPQQLRALASAPSVLHVAGGLERFLDLAHAESVALVGARRASPYGREMARSLGRSLASTGVTIISGMALGADAAAHEGALAAPGATIAVLPGGAERPYPPASRALYRRILGTGAAVSELPPATAARRWMFPARNRIIAALAAMTVVVEAGERSGALITARVAKGLGRPTGAVPGRVTTPTAAGSNRLLADGAPVVRDAQDVLDELFGAGTRTAARRHRRQLTPELEAVLAAVAAGDDTPSALERAGFAVADALAALAELELAGYLRRDAGGRFVVSA